MCISLVRYPPHLVQPRHSHPRAAVSIILSGALHEEWKSGAVTARAFSSVRKPPRAAHETRFGPEGAAILSVTTGEEARVAGDPRWTARAPIRRGVLDTLLASLAGGCEADFADAAQSFAAVLEPEEDIIGDNRASWLHDLFDRLAEEPASSSVADLARQCGVDPSYASRAFRKRYGLGPLQHRRRARCYRALNLLLGGATPATAAVETGFADQSHLTRELRARFDVTPGRLSPRQVKNLQDRGVLGE